MYLMRQVIRYRRVVGLVLFLLVLVVAVRVTGLRDHLNPDYLQHKLQDNLWSGLSLFAVIFALGNVAQIPGWIFLAAAVYALGRTNGGIATYIAASLSCMFTYLTVRVIAGRVDGTISNRFALRLLAQLHAHPVRNVAILRTLFQTLPALNYALALSGIGFRNYLIGTLIGLPLPIAVYCVFFDYLVTMAHRV